MAKKKQATPHRHRYVNDSDVPKFINLFTKLPIEERKKLSKLKDQEINEAKKILAFESE